MVQFHPRVLPSFAYPFSLSWSRRWGPGLRNLRRWCNSIREYFFTTRGLEVYQIARDRPKVEDRVRLPAGLPCSRDSAPAARRGAEPQKRRLHECHARVAQMDEHWSSKPSDAGSNPATGAHEKTHEFRGEVLMVTCGTPNPANRVRVPAPLYPAARLEGSSQEPVLVGRRGVSRGRRFESAVATLG